MQFTYIFEHTNLSLENMELYVYIQIIIVGMYDI